MWSCQVHRRDPDPVGQATIVFTLGKAPVHAGFTDGGEIGRVPRFEPIPGGGGLVMTPHSSQGVGVEKT